MKLHPYLAPLMAVLALAGCDNKKNAQAARAPVVHVSTLKGQKVALTTELPGRLSAYRVADVRPQVNGVILKRLFVEGGEVKEGQQLYQIDPAPYKASYDSAVAAAKRDRAVLEDAKIKVDRYRPLAQAQAVSKQDYDDAISSANQAEATVAGDEAAVETTRINLNYTKVFSPISGRIGRSNVTEGALVTANQTTALATVTQLDPIYADFTQSVSMLLRLRRELQNGTLQGSGNESPMQLSLDDGSLYDKNGKLQFSEVNVDQGTGTVLLRAIFPNKDELLLPGMFVHGKLHEATDENGILVPQQAVERDLRGDPEVEVIGPDNKAQLRSITTNGVIGQNWLVTSGLKIGERVVVEGQQNLSDGQTVTPQEVAMPQ